MKQKTCFVIIGYGVKTDYPTGREINLDKTFANIIEPVFKELGFLCFRAADVKLSGVIDLPMYENILKADFVLADLTTLNPNVLYELGIRHAVRKNTTVIISDSEIAKPFDLNHVLIESYEHLGKAIDHDEVVRFKKVLKAKVQALLDDPKVDSPLYTFFPNLQMPSFTEAEIEDIKEGIEAENSLSDLLTLAETAREERDFSAVIPLLNQALKINPGNVYILQRLAFATYQFKAPSPHAALLAAEKILEDLNPLNTTDIETLGLSGAINKRLYEHSGEHAYLEKAMWFYKKGFYIANDYYCGINAAYLLTLLSVTTKDQFEAWGYYGEANNIRKKVIEIGKNLINGKIWDERGDQRWVLVSIAEAYFGLGDPVTANTYVDLALPYINGSFTMHTFLEQQEKLNHANNTFRDKYINPQP